ncbi:MAG: CDP-alcohol phosphatidyltransferase family protein [Candidatus Methylomirabilis oxygeniifera]|uniref:CDP-alcohol phosphatidyltransferase n=1 Tax=Methylomirabilis oxygeniifera TaxID=671143 RepID=D5MMM3_METO1|nr:MAG: CDP-alcohol phosphatidyltransferase family protein [Candidatus Methylomirabilis oxyfera]CBE70145.1 CDP-alcohol phosphatidyltransferase [Candidatus Methylomirabilis oxyfera]
MTVYAHILGEAPATLWGLSSRERYRRVLAPVGVTAIADDLSSLRPDDSVLIVRGDYLLDSRVLQGLTESLHVMIEAPAGPSRALIVAHVPANLAMEARAVLSLEKGAALPPSVRIEKLEDQLVSFDRRLRKAEPPFAEPIRADTKRALEERLFSSSYKGVTDLVTKWLWPSPAKWAVHLCVAAGLRPNHVTAVSVLLVIAAAILFAKGLYGWGLAAGWFMTFLDTVDGKLARVTVTSTRFGHLLDHVLDLVHPPFWYLLWGFGLESFAPGIPWLTLRVVIWAIFIGYIGGRLVEGIFRKWLAGFVIFCWRPFDSYFRLVTARRNPNMILLTASLIFSRPDLGLVAVAEWTVLSTLVLLLRLGIAFYARTHGPLRSWLADDTGRAGNGSLAVRLFVHQVPTP